MGFLYPTLAIHNGAVHAIDGVTYLGTYVDGDIDGQPSPAAHGDDVFDALDDEDGVTFVTPFVPGWDGHRACGCQRRRLFECLG